MASVNLALHLVCSFTSSSVSEWSVCEVGLSKHSPVMFTQHQQTAYFHKTDPHMKNEQVWLVLYCLMRVSYICHETKVCVPHLIYQTEKKLGSNECSTQMHTYLPIQLYIFLSWFQWPLYDN